MTFRSAVSWGLAVLLVLAAAGFIWYDRARDRTEPEFVAERGAPVEPAALSPAEAPPDEEAAAKPVEPDPSGEEAAGAAEEKEPVEEDAPPDEGRGDEEATPPGREGEGADTPKAAADAGAPGREDPAAELPSPDAGSPNPALDEDAAEYVANLVEPSPDPIPGESASHFVGADQKIEFGSEDEAAPPGSTQPLAAATRPEAPPGVPSADVEPVVGKAGPTDAQDAPATTVGDPAAAEARPEAGAEPPGEETPGAEPKKELEAEAATPAEDRSEAGTAPPGEDRTETPTAAPGKKAGEPGSGAGKDTVSPPTTELAKKPGDAAAPAAEARTGTPAAVPMKKADDDIGELLSGKAPAAAAGKDEAPPPAEAPAKKLEPEPAADAEPASVTVPEAPEGTAGKDPAEAARAKTGASSSPEDAPAPRETITIRDVLAGVVEFGEDDVFYVHAVKPGDDQGLWGIIQEAVTGNFARGVRLTLGERTDTYRVAVPKDADELLDDRSSSPLGLMIHQKSQETIVYNRKLGRLTQDPDVTLYPGNELIIVGFEPEELIRLYKHFAGTDGG